MLAGVWQALGVAAGSTWIAMGGPSIHGSAGGGQVLRVDEAYLSRSQAFIFALFSGIQENGSSEGRGGVASRCGHKHIVLHAMVGSGQPSLRALMALMSGETLGTCGCLSEVSLTKRVLVELSRDGKVCGSRPRVSSES